MWNADPDPRGDGASERVVEVLHIPGCPHMAVAAGNLRQALADGGFVDVVIRFVEVSTEEDAVRGGFGGSPTFRAGGRVPFGDPRVDGVGCRIYRTPGGLRGAPTVAQLTGDLAASLCAGS